MVALKVLTVSGMPAFTLNAGKDDSVAALVKAAARKAAIMPKDFKPSKIKLVDAKEVDGVRLSCGRRFLFPADTVASLGLQNGSVLTMHVKTKSLIRGTTALPSFSFSSEGYGFYIGIVLASGKELFRLKITPDDSADAVTQAALRRAKISHGLKPTAKGAARLEFKAKKLPPKSKLSECGIMVDDSLVLHGMLGEEAPPPRPRSPRDLGSSGSSGSIGNDLLGSGSSPFLRSLSRPSSAGGSFNAIARSAPSSNPDSPRAWLPVGPTNMFT